MLVSISYTLNTVMNRTVKEQFSWNFYKQGNILQVKTCCLEIFGLNTIVCCRLFIDKNISVNFMLVQEFSIKRTSFEFIYII